MNELITVSNGIATVNSRDVAMHFGKEHSEVLKRIKGYDRIVDGKLKHIDGILDQFDSGVNTLEYIIPNQYKDISGKMNMEYLLTRDGFSLIVMGFTGSKALEWKLKYIEAFNKMELALKEQNKKAQLLLAIYDGGQSGIIAAKQLTEIEVQEATKPLLQTIEEQKPLVDFADKVTKSCDNILMRQMAKLLYDQNIKVGEKRLYKLLRGNEVLMKNNEPYQSYLDRGYFYVKEATFSTPSGEKLSRTTLVTPKGQIWMVGKVKEWLVA